MNNETRASRRRFYRAEGSARLTSAVAFFVALAVSTATPSLCQAQVTGLGSAANYGMLEDGGNVNIGSTFIFWPISYQCLERRRCRSRKHHGRSRFYGSSLNVTGTLTEWNAHFTGAGANNVTATGGVVNTPGAQATLNGAWSAAQSASTSYSKMTGTQSISNNKIIATGAVTVVDVQSITHDLTISGAAGQIVVINVTGSSSGNAINLSNVTLSGVTANDVVFNVTGSGDVNLGGGTVNGTFIANGSGSVSLSGTTLNGAILTGSDISTSGAVTLNAAPMAAVGAPELPSVAMAGVACLLILGRAGLGRIRRARAA